MQKITLLCIAVLTTAAHCCQEKQIQIAGATAKAMQDKSNYWYPTFPPKPVNPGPRVPGLKPVNPNGDDPRFKLPNPQQIDPGFTLPRKKPSFYVPVKNGNGNTVLKRPIATNNSPLPLKRQRK